MKAFPIPDIASSERHSFATIGILLLLTFLTVAYTEGSSSFEVASIKPAPMTKPGGGCWGGPGTKDPGRWTCENASLLYLVRMVFDLRLYQLQGLSAGNDLLLFFNITANIPENSTKEQFRQMQQNLLIERFGLKFHREEKEMQGYELVIAKNGPKFKEPEPSKNPAAIAQNSGAGSKDRFPFTPGRDGLPIIPKSVTGYWMSSGGWRGQFVRTTLDKMALFFSGQTGKPVTDSTGLKGEYDLSLEWTPEALGNIATPPGPQGTEPTASEPSFPNLFTALQEQLGLKLQPKKVTVEIFVIDHIERTPTEN